jgi:hypothetical protein
MSGYPCPILGWTHFAANRDSPDLADGVASGALSRRRGVDLFVRFALQTSSTWRGA